jgi:hypothetical protein
MARCKGAAEVSERSRALVKDGAEPRARHIAVDHEGHIEVRHLQYGPGDQGALQCMNVVVASSSHANASHRKRRVSGAAIMPKSRMNFW